MSKPVLVYCAVWHRRHGVDVFLSRTENGSYKIVAEQVVLQYLSEIKEKGHQKRLKELCGTGKYHDAIWLWGQLCDDEYVDFYQTILND